jgi:hypothetical protein
MNRIFYKIKRVFQFLPIIWKGFDFDAGYAEDLYLYQLERVLKCLRSSNIRDNSYSASKLETYIKLYKKVKNEDYLINYFDIVKDIYKDENLFEMIFESKNGENTYSMKMAYEDYPNVDDIKKDISLYREKGKIKHEKAEKILTKYWLRYRCQWWD